MDLHDRREALLNGYEHNDICEISSIMFFR